MNIAVKWVLSLCHDLTAAPTSYGRLKYREILGKFQFLAFVPSHLTSSSHMVCWRATKQLRSDSQQALPLRCALSSAHLFSASASTSRLVLGRSFPESFARYFLPGLKQSCVSAKRSALQYVFLLTTFILFLSSLHTQPPWLRRSTRNNNKSSNGCSLQHSWPKSSP